MELTKECLDKALSTQTEQIKKELEQVEDRLGQMIASGFADIEKRLDVRDRVDALENKMKKVEQALHATF
jgi:hypothetical protein